MVNPIEIKCDGSYGDAPKKQSTYCQRLLQPINSRELFLPTRQKIDYITLYLGISPVGSNVLKVERLPAVICGVSRMLGSPRGGQKLRFLVFLQKFATPKIVLSNYTPHKQKGERCPKTGCP